MPASVSPRRRSLVARLDSFGDVLLCGPAIRAVAADADVTVLCGPMGRAAAELLPGVASIIEHHAGWISADAPAVTQEAIAALVRDVADEGFDEAIILTSARQSSLPTALVLRLAGLDRIVGLSVDFPGSLLDDCIREDLDVHEVERALAIVALAGHRLPPDDDGCLRVSASQRGPGRVAGDVDAGYVVVHPGASVPARTLSPATWRTVIEHLSAAGYRVVVTGTAGEGPPLDDLPASVVDLVGATDGRSLAHVLADAGAVCVGNTGVMHLAAAVGTPVCAVFPPTVPLHRWRPWRVPHVVLGEQDVECRSCRARSCPLDEQHCLSPVTPAAVLDAVARLITGRPPPSPAAAEQEVAACV